MPSMNCSGRCPGIRRAEGAHALVQTSCTQMSRGIGQIARRRVRGRHVGQGAFAFRAAKICRPDSDRRNAARVRGARRPGRAWSGWSSARHWARRIWAMCLRSSSSECTGAQAREGFRRVSSASRSVVQTMGSRRNFARKTKAQDRRVSAQGIRLDNCAVSASASPTPAPDAAPNRTVPAARHIRPRQRVPGRGQHFCRVARRCSRPAQV